jgi:hypothetical protein
LTLPSSSNRMNTAACLLKSETLWADQVWVTRREKQSTHTTLCPRRLYTTLKQNSEKTQSFYLQW